ncbi:MAG: sugar kinase, partial [Pyrinomonadaceae bacterium]|nr:sugar kinase [Pyrinomonadaceae bacterium]
MSLERTPEQERLTAIVRRFPQRKVVVVGDLVADQSLYGEISRVSREAPVLILRHERTETTPGGAANCAVNLASLDARAVLIGVTGEDKSGDALLGKLRAARVECSGVIRSAEVQTTTKVRILAGQTHSTRQQVLRVDYESQPLEDAEVHEQLRARLREATEDADAIIVSDYNYGVADESMATIAREIAERRGIPLLVDSRFRLSRFPGFTSATPNEDEVEQLLELHLETVGEMEASCSQLRERLNFRALLVTRGSNGMLLLEDGAAPLHIEAV